jgi:hypothetical protein
MNQEVKKMKRNIISFLSVGTALILLIPHCLMSQDIKNNTKPVSQNKISNSAHNWINGGIGVCSFGLSSGANFSHQSGKKLISVRATYNEELNIFGPSPSEQAWDVGVMYGRIAKSKYGFASISAGLGLVNGVKRGRYIDDDFQGRYGWFAIVIDRYEKIDFLTLGIPAEIQAFWTPFSKLGIGITLYGNFNPEKSFAGLLVSIQIGDLR